MARWNPSNFSGEQLGFIADRNAAVKDARGLRLETQGFRQLAADLKALEPAVGKELQKEIKQAADKIAVTGGALAPRGESGDLQHSIRPRVSGLTASVGSSLPYANVLHWGGSTGRGHIPGRPWSGSVFIRPSLFLSRAIDDHADEFAEDVGDAIERAAFKTGWSRGGPHHGSLAA
jgi:phage gpG-like protein